MRHLCYESFSLPDSVEIGRSAYEKSFGVNFIDEGRISASVQHNFLSRVIPKSVPYGFPSISDDKSVAVVGNGEVENCGSMIDSHDEVFRISSMRNWKKDCDNDGLRITWWAGHLAFVVNECGVNQNFAELVESNIPLWALSPFHISCDSWLWLHSRPSLPRILILPTGAVLFDIYHEYMNALEIEDLFSIPPTTRQLSGLSRYERLLTGTRLILALEACGIRKLSLYGFDLFANNKDEVWFGHDIAVDRKVLDAVARRYKYKGFDFNWIHK